MTRETGIMIDGPEHAQKSNENRIRADIEKMYAEKLAAAPTYLERRKVKLEMKREIKRSLKQLKTPSPYSL